MKFTSVFNDFSTNDFYLLGLFVLYLVVPFHTPRFMYNFLVHPVGLIVLLCTAVYMFFSVPHILAILYVLVIYELLRRDGGSKKPQHSKNKDQQYNYITDPVSIKSIHSEGVISEEPMNASEDIDEEKEEEFALPLGDSLEELIISESSPIQYESSGNNDNFRPISENNLGGSMF